MNIKSTKQVGCTIISQLCGINFILQHTLARQLSLYHPNNQLCCVWFAPVQWNGHSTRNGQSTTYTKGGSYRHSFPSLTKKFIT